MRLFKALISPSPDDIILDVGGFPGFWQESHLVVQRIDSLNLEYVAPPPPGQLPLVRTLVGDGCNLPFPDKSYDIAFSNSVIEHVDTQARQQKFAAEIRRIGRRIWVQTPAYAFPLEPHSLMPFLHWLPLSVRKRLFRFTPAALMWSGDISVYINMMATTRILKKSEMRTLFPDCTIMTEKIFGVFPKSYIAFRNTEPAAAGRL